MSGDIREDLDMNMREGLRNFFFVLLGSLKWNANKLSVKILVSSLAAPALATKLSYLDRCRENERALVVHILQQLALSILDK